MADSPPASPLPSTLRSSTLRSTARRAIQADVTKIAMQMFRERGFEATTVDQIAAAAGMSRSSFFRYFATKEDVVLGNLASHGQVIADALEARPASEPPWTALRNAIEPFVQTRTANAEEAMKLARIVTETPSIRARQHEKTMAWQSQLVPQIARRLNLADATDPRPAALVSCALSCLDAAIAAWTARDARVSLSELFEVAMNAVHTDLPTDANQR